MWCLFFHIYDRLQFWCILHPIVATLLEILLLMVVLKTGCWLFNIYSIFWSINHPFVGIMSAHFVGTTFFCHLLRLYLWGMLQVMCLWCCMNCTSDGETIIQFTQGSIPDWFKLQECKRGRKCNKPPMLYIFRGMNSKRQWMLFLTWPNLTVLGNVELSVSSWPCSTPQQFIMPHITIL